MIRRMLMLLGLATAVAAPGAAQAEGTIKIGVIMPYSGVLADTAFQMDGGIKLYMKLNGDKVAGKSIEIIRKDTGGIAPDVAKRLAQELVVRDQVDILAGFVLTPNAIAAAEVSALAKKPIVIMNAATSVVVSKSPYAVRVSMTLPQVTAPFGTWAAQQGIKSVYTLVADYGPGHDAEGAFIGTFKAGGGQVLGSLRMPVTTVDFSPFVQRAKDSGAQSIFVFIPAGNQPAAIMKTLLERGVTPDKIKVLGSGELTDDSALKGASDAALGVLTAYHYDHSHKSALNEKFVAAFRDANKGVNPNLLAVGGYDGMHLIYEVLRKTSGNADAEAFIAAARGMRWESPRGAIEIDRQTRDVVQTIYIRRVEKAGEGLRNVEIGHVDNVKDPGGKPQ